MTLPRNDFISLEQLKNPVKNQGNKDKERKNRDKFTCMINMAF